MSDGQDPAVSEGEETRVEEVRAVLREYFIFIDEYQKAICVREQCRKAVEPWYAGTHLRKTHKVSRVLTKRISKMIRQGEKGSDKGIPNDGTLLQEGLPVFDGFRCGGCSQFKARSMREVEGHYCRTIWHEEDKDYIIEQVRLQSWGGWGGSDQRFWVVEELKDGENEKIEEAPVEEAPATMEEEADPKEIPYNNSEESEDWSEEDGPEEREGCKEKEKFDGWEGDCFGWKWREAEHAGWDEMAGDWVVMY
ncbi:hypothetical protein V498_00912 [Pseudogymnoascus sp. VKM F-4517 (FW-2822)]|nr:hypothetical protein V498_00912 [Pseudogymnoascus sp. VKM F-4517 (FW-2822)]